MEPKDDILSDMIDMAQRSQKERADDLMQDHVRESPKKQTLLLEHKQPEKPLIQSAKSVSIDRNDFSPIIDSGAKNTSDIIEQQALSTDVLSDRLSDVESSIQAGFDSARRRDDESHKTSKAQLKFMRKLYEEMYRENHKIELTPYKSVDSSKQTAEKLAEAIRKRKETEDSGSDVGIVGTIAGAVGLTALYNKYKTYTTGGKPPATTGGKPPATTGGRPVPAGGLGVVSKLGTVGKIIAAGLVAYGAGSRLFGGDDEENESSGSYDGFVGGQGAVGQDDNTAFKMQAYSDLQNGLITEKEYEYIVRSSENNITEPDVQAPLSGVTGTTDAQSVYDNQNNPKPESAYAIERNNEEAARLFYSGAITREEYDSLVNQKSPPSSSSGSNLIENTAIVGGTAYLAKQGLDKFAPSVTSGLNTRIAAAKAAASAKVASAKSAVVNSKPAKAIKSSVDAVKSVTNAVKGMGVKGKIAAAALAAYGTYKAYTSVRDSSEGSRDINDMLYDAENAQGLAAYNPFGPSKLEEGTIRYSEELDEQERRKASGEVPLRGKERTDFISALTLEMGFLPDPRTGYPLKGFNYDGNIAKIMSDPNAVAAVKAGVPIEKVLGGDISTYLSSQGVTVNNTQNANSVARIQKDIINSLPTENNTDESSINQTESNVGPVSNLNQTESNVGPVSNVTQSAEQVANEPMDDLTKAAVGITTVSAAHHMYNAIKPQTVAPAAPAAASAAGGAGSKLLGGAGVAFAVYDAYEIMADEQLKAEEKAKEVAKLAGANAGAMVGATAGATAGSLVVPIIGTVIGGAIGGAIGYLGGSSATEEIVEGIQGAVDFLGIGDALGRAVAIPMAIFSDEARDTLALDFKNNIVPEIMDTTLGKLTTGFAEGMSGMVGAVSRFFGWMDDVEKDVPQKDKMSTVATTVAKEHTVEPISDNKTAVTTPTGSVFVENQKPRVANMVTGDTTTKPLPRPDANRARHRYAKRQQKQMDIDEVNKQELLPENPAVVNNYKTTINNIESSGVEPVVAGTPLPPTVRNDIITQNAPSSIISSVPSDDGADRLSVRESVLGSHTPRHVGKDNVDIQSNPAKQTPIPARVGFSAPQQETVPVREKHETITKVVVQNPETQKAGASTNTDRKDVKNTVSHAKSTKPSLSDSQGSPLDFGLPLLNSGFI